MEELMEKFEDPTKIKDEQGQTILHIAAVKEQRSGVLYNLISQAEFLLPERDCGYRSARDVAFKVNLQRNVVEIDQYIVDSFLKRKVDFLKMLAHEGYDHILNVVDRTGRNISSILLQHNMDELLTLLQDIADFQKRRDELHTFIRHGYLQGIQNLIKNDKQLVTAKSIRSRCSLHIAVLFENIEVIEALIGTNSAAVHVSDNLGRTPLHYAMATKAANKIAHILLKAGSLKSRRDVRMRMPSYYYVYKQEIKDIKSEEERIS